MRHRFLLRCTPLAHPRPAILGCAPWPRVSPMRRRDLITLLGGAVAAWPLAARAQQVIPRTIGVLGSATPASQGERYAVFAERLRALGWIEKRNVTFEYRWAHGRRGVQRDRGRVRAPESRCHRHVGD